MIDSPADILRAHASSEIHEYFVWKEKIRTCSYDGAKKLITNLKQAEQSADGISFLNFLAEFNFAVNFFRHRIRFAYEPRGYDDFLTGDALSISVKSLQSKGYAVSEGEMILDMRRKSEKNGKSYSGHLDHGHSSVKLVVDGSSYERMEIAHPGHPFASERREKSNVLSLIADEQEKERMGKRKVLFLFVQNQGIGATDFSDIANWYFDSSVRSLDRCKQYYAADFKTKTDTVLEKDGSVEALVYFFRPRNVLLWPENFLSQPGKYILAGKDESLNNHIESFFDAL